jgi:NADH-quinone oxidoreductase subunit J
VFATGDSIATPALLPDGSTAPDSISPLVEPSLPVEPGLRPDRSGLARTDLSEERA